MEKKYTRDNDPSSWFNSKSGQFVNFVQCFEFLQTLLQTLRLVFVNRIREHPSSSPFAKTIGNAVYLQNLQIMEHTSS